MPFISFLLRDDREDSESDSIHRDWWGGAVGAQPWIHLFVRRNLYEVCRSVNEVFRTLVSCRTMRLSIILPVCAVLTAPSAFADATIQQKTQLHFGGALGSVINV